MYVLLEHCVIQGLPEAAPYEIGPERFEHVLEGPHTRPFAHRVAHVRTVGQHVGHHGLVHVGAMVHGVDDDITLGDALQRRFVLVINGHAVQEIEHDLGEVVADLVIGQNVQLRHDLVDVLLDPPTHVGVGKRVFLGGAEGRCFDDRISREGRFGGAALLQMVARQARGELVDGAEGPPSEPPGHATPPPSFLSWAYPIPRRMAMRFAMGGWVARASAKSPSCAVRRRPSGSAMQRRAAPRLMAAVGATAPSIFWSAPASATGLRVNWALMASARYSRLRLTASARSCVMIGARIHEMIHTTSRMRSSRPAPPFFPPPREPPPPPPPPPPLPQLPPPRLVPPRSTRLTPSCIRATAPTNAASSVISRTSRFLICPSSCPTTAWSASRLQISSRPRVTATCACSGSVPVANAFGSGSSTIQIRGRGIPAAMAISSTTLTSCFSCGSVGSTMARAPVDQSTFSGPVAYAYQAVSSAMTVSAIPNHGNTWWYTALGSSRVYR